MSLTTTRILGIFGLLAAICLYTGYFAPDTFLQAANIQGLILRTSLYGIISIGVAFVIITGGIDLSIGSVVGLIGCLLPMFLAVEFVPRESTWKIRAVDADAKRITFEEGVGELRPGDQLTYQLAGSSAETRLTIQQVDAADGAIIVRESPGQLAAGASVGGAALRHMNIPLACFLVLLISAAIGLVHGLLITQLGLQPFVVTLCGLLIYRGIARGLTDDKYQGFGIVFDDGFRVLGNGSIPLTADFGLPIPFFFLLAIGVLAAVFLNKTIYGRYLMALGRNEQAARYSGINTNRMKILAYVLCSLLAGVGGILFALRLNSVQPASHGNFYELYAVAAAVLGGCSLRGGEGTILGVVIGAAVMRVLQNAITLLDYDDRLEFAIIGGVILAGVVADETVRRIAARRRAVRQARAAA